MDKMKKPAAFTLAEVLITLAIIGVVAALTIPTVITNYQKKMYVTQLKKSYNNLSNAFRTIMANDGVTELSETTLWSKIPSDYFFLGDMLQPKNAEFKNEFLKNFKVVAAYSSGSFPEEYKPKYKHLNGTDRSSLSSAIYLADGTLLDIKLYKTPLQMYRDSKKCSSLKEFQETRNTKTKLWQEAGYIDIDVNGVKGPNIVGRDLFAFSIGNDGELYPMGGADFAVYHDCEYDNLDSCTYYWKNESNYYPCTKSSNGVGCAGRIMEEGWEMKY